MTPSAKAYAAAIKSLTARKGLTFASVAESTGMEPNVLRRRLSVVDGPNSQIRLLSLVADALGITLRSLLAEAEACQEAVSDV